MSRKGESRGDFSTLPPGVHFDPIILPDMASAYYARRADRLRKLAENSEVADYLNFAADIADAQEALATAVAQESDLDLPLDPVALAGKGAWLPLLDTLLDGLRPRLSEALVPHQDSVAAMNRSERIAAVTALAGGRFVDVSPEQAPFLWAAFSSYVRALAATVTLPETGEDGAAEHATCPVCTTAPVASVILIGARQGLRYLHCALCETDWHMVRAKCTNCGQSGKLDYLSFDTEQAAVRAECCDDCNGYLKVVSLDRDHEAEVVADDLAALALDAAVEGEGYERTGFNPFALPG